MSGTPRPVRVALLGAAGRMGRTLAPLIQQSQDFDLVLSVDRDPGEGSATSSLAALEPGALDAVIEFTAASAVPGIAREVARLGVAWLSGTTGLGARERAALAEAGSRAPVLWSPNYAIGIAFASRALELAARLLPGNWELEIVESHHAAKLDAPSGTATALADVWLGERRGEIVHGRSGRSGPRPPHEVGIHAVRLPDSVGEHRLVIGGPSETIEITHRALDRGVFARGAIEGLRWLLRQPPGLYSLDQWIEERRR